MARLDPISHVEDVRAEAALSRLEQLVGYRPNALATMARLPGVLGNILELVDVVLRSPGVVPSDFKWLVALATSWAAGCPYSACHAAHGAEHLGEPIERVRGAINDPAGPLFTVAEKSALRLSASIGRQQIDAPEVESVRAHYGEVGLAEIVAVCSLFGWFNRWNATLASDLEDEPARFAMQHLSEAGWLPGVHKVPIGIV